MVDTSDFKQIIPAPDNLYVVYKDDQTQEEFEMKVLCLGLTEIGNIEMIEVDDSGWISACEGFERVIYK